MVGASQLWLYHPSPLPDELLSSWLVRISHGHEMKLQTFFRVSLGKGQEIWTRDIDRQAPEWLLHALSEHTGISIQDIRYVPCMQISDHFHLDHKDYYQPFMDRYRVGFARVNS